MESSYLGDENAAKLIEAFRNGRKHDGEEEPTQEELDQFIAYWEHTAMVSALMRATLGGYLVVNVRHGAMMAFYSNPDNPIEAHIDNPLADQIEDILQHKDWGEDDL